MNNFKDLIDEEVDIEISGKAYFSGILIDNGLDILVLYNGRKYMYIPLLHLHNIKKEIIQRIHLRSLILKCHFWRSQNQYLFEKY